jgi:UPF0176 protein
MHFKADLQIFAAFLIYPPMSYKIAAFYRFTPLQDLHTLRRSIRDYAAACEGMCGTILLAPEGINATIGATPGGLDRMIDFLDETCGIKQGELKFSTATETPFNRFKVRLKKEIITLRRPEADPNIRVGTYVAPENWNALIDDPEVVLIDTRNDYETKVGIFKGAIDPKIRVFTDFPNWVEKNLNPQKHKKVAMFCTGGIRCEKASSYMLAHGFEEVYHLKGGILKYLETISTDQSRWDGECFVFDKRVAVGHGLEEGASKICYGCRAPLSAEETQHPSYEEGVACPHCIKTLAPIRADSLRQRHKQLRKQYGS